MLCITLHGREREREVRRRISAWKVFELKVKGRSLWRMRWGRRKCVLKRPRSHWIQSKCVVMKTSQCEQCWPEYALLHHMHQLHLVTWNVQPSKCCSGSQVWLQPQSWLCKVRAFSSAHLNSHEIYSPTFPCRVKTTFTAFKPHLVSFFIWWLLPGAALEILPWLLH